MKRIFTISSLCLLFFANIELMAQCSTPSVVIASPSVICLGSTTSLTASSANTDINWYTVSVAGTTVGTSTNGTSFVVSPTVNTTYYAESYGNPTSYTLNYTGGVQTYTVPSGVTTLTVDLMGAKGGSGYPSVSGGGNGGRVTGTISVIPGQVLEIYVGGVGGNASASLAGSAGFNGGGIGALYSGSYGGGGGGGASDIRVPPYTFSDRIAVAGGGGGGAYNSSTANYDKGGFGNGPTGEAGYSNGVSATGAGGYGGTQSAGGNGGFWSGYCTASNGNFGIGGNAGSCTNSGGGGGGGYYGGGGGVWAGGGGGSSYLLNGNFTGGFQNGNGMVVITAPGCISSRAAVTVTVNTLPTISVNNGTICAGQSFTITPSGANSYTIEGGNNIVSPSSNSTYTVSGISIHGCNSQNTATANVVVNTNPVITVNSGTICEGTSYTITPNGTDTYIFEGGSAVVSPSISTTYTVVGTNTITGCMSQIASSSLTVLPAPTISANNGTICSSQSFTIIPSGAATYTIEGGNNIISPLSNTSYTISGTSIEGCNSLNTATANIMVYSTPTISINSGTVCEGSSFTLTPSGADSYVYEGGSAIVSPTINTTYTVVGTNTITGCTSQMASSSISVSPSPIISINNATICAGETFTISPSGAVSYTIEGENNIVTPLSNTNYTLTGSSAEGCVAINIVTLGVNVNNLPIISINGPTVICQGEIATLMSSGADTYTWSNGSTASNVSVTPTTNTNYSVAGTSTLTGCSSSSNHNILVNVCTGIISLSNNLEEVVVFPNPNNGSFTVNFNNNDKKTIEVIDMTGKLLLNHITDEQSFDVNLLEYSGGIYNLKIQSNGEVRIMKVIIQ